MLDENVVSISGCSIDSSVAQIRSIAQKLNIDLFDRMNLAFLNEAGQLETVHANRVSAAFENGILNEQTTVFNNMVTSYSELRTNWRIPLVNSWAGSRIKVV
jgi:hypothetical protein